MDNTSTFQEFLNTYIPFVPLWPFLPHLFGAGLLCYVLGLFYVRYGRSLSNRRALGRNFLVIGMTTMLIIAVVKSSLALSLGMVGALSIVRFRTAIKEPEELAYLFLAIAVGLGFGAGQWLVTSIAFVLILAALWLRHRAHAPDDAGGLFLTVSCPKGSGLRLDDLVGALRPCCSALRLKRFDESDGSVEALFAVDFDDYAQLEKATGALRQRHEAMRVSFLEAEGLP